MQFKGRIMETRTQNATITEWPPARETSDGEVKAREESQSGPFEPRATLLLDVAPTENDNATPHHTAQGPAKEPPEDMLRLLLMNTEASARRMQSSRSKWQFASLMLGMLLIAAAAVVGWLYLDIGTKVTPRAELKIENGSLKGQLNTAGVQIAGFKNEVEALLSRNIELAAENAKLKSQSNASIAAVPPAVAKAIPTAEQTPDAGRVEAIKKGTFTNGTTRAELTAALGKPDRVYKSRNYEQLVYFGRKPGRFWLVENRLVQVSQ